MDKEKTVNAQIEFANKLRGLLLEYHEVLTIPIIVGMVEITKQHYLHEVLFSTSSGSEEESANSHKNAEGRDRQ